MALDPRTALALAVQSHKGIYALLLGSGISRSAGVPTGWEVVVTLIKRIAAAEGTSSDPDPAAWYKARFGVDPTYNEIVERLAPKQAERLSLLRPLFEPTPAEAEDGLKKPTSAHKAIAKLVAAGYFRVIITTNFDRLMERALQDEGISPTIVATPDQVGGMMPPQHTACLVFKIHGDYLDTRLLNTTEELKDYDPRLKGLLDRILTDYGLIICGWSADWDVALGDALDRTTHQRFTTFWMQRGSPSERAAGFAQRRNAVIIPIDAADKAFSDLSEQVAAIESIATVDPLSASVATAMMKKYLASPSENRIRIHDTIIGETKSLRRKTDIAALPTSEPSPTKEEFVRRVRLIEGASQVLLAMLSTIVRWGMPDQYELCSKVIAILGRGQIKSGNSFDVWQYLLKYPAVLALYAMGTVAAGNANTTLIKRLLRDTKVIDQWDKEIEPARVLTPNAALWYDLANSLFSQSRRTPCSDHIHDHLKTMVVDVFDQPEDFSLAFDFFEICLSITRVTLNDRPFVGSFLWRGRPSEHALNRIANEVKAVGGSHPIFGLGGITDPAHLSKILEQITDSVLRHQ